MLQCQNLLISVKMIQICSSNHYRKHGLGQSSHPLLPIYYFPANIGLFNNRIHSYYLINTHTMTKITSFEYRSINDRNPVWEYTHTGLELLSSICPKQICSDAEQYQMVIIFNTLFVSTRSMIETDPIIKQNRRFLEWKMANWPKLHTMGNWTSMVRIGIPLIV